MDNIFEELNKLINSVKNINESKEEKGYEDIPIHPDMETREQAREYIKKFFIDLLEREGKEGTEETEGPEGPSLVPTTPPPPPVKGGTSGGSGETEDEDDLLWDKDDLESIDLGDDVKGEDESGDGGEGTGGEGTEGESEGEEKGESEGEGGEKGDSEGEGGEKGESKGEGGEKGESKGEGEEKGESEGEGGEKGESEGEGGEKGDSEGEGGEKGGGGESSSSKSLKDTIKDALKELAERNESEKESLKKLLDKVEKDDVKSSDIDKMSKESEDKKNGERESNDKLKSMVGRMEDSVSKKEIEDEIEASKLSEKEIEDLKKETLSTSDVSTLPKDEELDELRKRAIEELDKKTKGKSKLSKSILYHSLKSANVDKDEWYILIENILKKKSKHNGKEKTKTKVITLGDKNHIWRDVRYGYKVKKRGSDTQNIYCFVDYSGSVSSRPGLIQSFLGKVIGFGEKLKYSSITTYAFGDNLSLPKKIDKKMLDEDGIEKILTDTIDFFDSQSDSIGGSIENFREVAYEIIRIKREDKDAVFFIFGDGIWTFYGNSEPPTRLKEICPQYIDDIIPFIFYIEEGGEKRMKDYLNYVGKEVSVLKDVVGIKNVIFTKADKMKH